MSILTKLVELEKKYTPEENEDNTNIITGEEGLKVFAQTGMINQIFAAKNLGKGYSTYEKRKVKVEHKFKDRWKEIMVVTQADKASIENLLQRNLHIDMKTIKQYQNGYGWILSVDTTFNPHMEPGLTRTGAYHTLNTFTKTDYMEISDAIPNEDRLNTLSEEEFKRLFPHTYTYFMNLCENNWNYTSQLFNWVAVHLATRQKISTSWVFQSMPGAGKDTFSELYLEELYGPTHVEQINVDSVKSRFNKSLMNSLIVILNESTTNPNEANKISAVLKNWITESSIKIEPKGVDAFNVDTYFGMIVFSNENVPIPIEIGDRRISIMQSVSTMPEYAKEIFNLDVAEFRDKLLEEQKAFLLYLSTVELDVALARKCILNSTKKKVQRASQKRNSSFEKLLKSRKVEDIQTLYEDLSETLYAKNMDPECVIDYAAEINDLNQFIGFVIDGRVPQSLMAKFYKEYVNHEVTLRQAESKITDLFGAGKVTSIKGTSYRVKRLGTPLNVALNAIVNIEESELITPEEAATYGIKIAHNIEISAADLHAANIVELSREDLIRSAINNN
jgi:hypothetical protein